jgi:hypothetical protein
MMLRFFVLILLFVPVKLSSLHDQRRQTIERVRLYLRQGTMARTFSSTNWLENSNKIGFGYNLLGGSPICYTGQCQMDRFTHSIFKLNYTSPAIGSCTNKLVPENVELDCLPSISQTFESENIETIEQLHKSISNKVDVSISAKFRGVEFSYGFSKETQYMIDNIVKKDQISIVSILLSIYD